jgi:hypothetical protein
MVDSLTLTVGGSWMVVEVDHRTNEFNVEVTEITIAPTD